MTTTEIAGHRLNHHQIAATKFKNPEEVVAWLGAVQSQDYAHSKWAVGTRLPQATDASVEQALIAKKIVRTWALRGTLHLLAAEDVRWILALLGPVVLAKSVGQYKKFDLGDHNFPKISEAIIRVLEGGKQLTRDELFAALEQHGIATTNLRGSNILYRAALERTICLGSWMGKQPTYTLLDEWLPDFPIKPRELALAELAQRYFQSHGPATLQDFANWSGLNLGDCKTGLEQIKSELVQVPANDQTYWMTESTTSLEQGLETVHLLAGFDEFLLGYKDRSIILDAAHQSEVVSFNGIFKPTVIINGRVAGMWRRSFKKDKVLFETTPFTTWTKIEKEAIHAKATEYARFMDKASIDWPQGSL